MFIWKVAWCRLLTKAFLRAKGIDILITYPSYEVAEENVERVLFRCPRVVCIWRLAFPSRVGISKELSSQIFLEALMQSSMSEATYIASIGIAYLAYQI